MDWKIIFATIVLGLTYFLIVWERIPRVVTALLGASLLLLFHVVSQEQAFASIDFNVIFLLVGMMILVNIFGHTGALDALAIWSAKCTGGNGAVLMLAFGALSAFLSAFLDNVTTILLLGNVTCVIAKRLNINPVPLLICEAICSNVGGTATLIGDPPNIMIGSAAGLSFNDFLITLGPVVLLILPVALTTLYFIYRRELILPAEAKAVLTELSGRAAICDRSLMVKALVVFVLVLAGFALHGRLQLEAGTIALAGASLLLVFENRKSIWRDVEWTTIFFFIGLFIVVGAVEKTGALSIVADQLVRLADSHSSHVSMAILWASALCSAVVDNIPYTATMIPVVRTLQTHCCMGEPLWWALALGSCLGGNGSLVGATANIVAADLAEAAGARLGFVHFTVVGSIVALESLVVSSVYLSFLGPPG